MTNSTLWTIIGIVVLIYVALSTLAAYVMVRIPRLPLKDNPSSVGLSYENVSFPSRKDKLTLKGWYIAGKKAFSSAHAGQCGNAPHDALVNLGQVHRTVALNTGQVRAGAAGYP